MNQIFHNHLILSAPSDGFYNKSYVIPKVPRIIFMPLMDCFRTFDVIEKLQLSEQKIDVCGMKTDLCPYDSLQSDLFHVELTLDTAKILILMIFTQE